MTPMRPQTRPAFSLVEMMVAMALILFVMAILSSAFVAGLDSFRTLKSIGDMEERLRTATMILRRDLAADHFEGKRRLSDPMFWQQPIREGFVQIYQLRRSEPEGTDTDGNASYRATDHALHFSVKLRGNRGDKFFAASLPAGSPLLNLPTTFFGQPPDARFQEASNTYNSPWAEVIYRLVPLTGAGSTAGGTPLFTLYRGQRVAVTDNRNLNWPDRPVAGQVPVPASMLASYGEVSCIINPTNAGSLYFLSPNDLARRNGRSLGVSNTSLNGPPRAGEVVLLHDVISFDVRLLKYRPEARRLTDDFEDISATGGVFDTDGSTSVFAVSKPDYVINALEVSVRVWDRKTEQTRQVTIIQDM